MQIFWDDNILEKMEGGNFWLSETPEMPGVVGWDAAHVRMFRGNKDKILTVFNTQLDHIGKVARNESVVLLWDQMTSIVESRKTPIILLGDFNDFHINYPYQYLTGKEGAHLTDAYKVAETQLGNEVSFTYHGWMGPNKPEEKNTTAMENHIDWILFHPASLEVKRSQVITEARDKEGTLFPSDHYPLTSLFSFPE